MDVKAIAILYGHTQQSAVMESPESTPYIIMDLRDIDLKWKTRKAPFAVKRAISLFSPVQFLKKSYTNRHLLNALKYFQKEQCHIWG